jgi:hypothetical protein
MVDSADLIVVGYRVQGLPLHQQKIHELIRVDRTLKGRLAPDVRVVDIGALPDNTNTPPIYGMFMLQAHEGGYRLSRDGYTNLVASPIQALSVCDAVDAIHTVACELVNVLMLPERIATDRGVGLVRSIMSVDVVVGYDKDGNPISKTEPPSDIRLAEDVYDRALEALYSIPFDVRAPYLLRALDKERHIGAGRPYVLASLIAGGDLFDGSRYMEDFLHPREEARVTEVDLKLAIERIPRTPGLEDFLKALMKSSNRDVRSGTAERLAVMGTPSAVQALQPGLDDVDFGVRKEVVEHICGHTGICDFDQASRLALPSNIPQMKESLRVWVSQHSQ